MPVDIKYSEEELVALLKMQSREAFEYLYANYSNVLYGVVRRVIQDEQTAQDVLQEAFVKIWSNISRYDAAKGRIYTWMLNIARNTAIDKLRSKGEVMKGKIQTGDDFVFNSQKGATEQATDTIGVRKAVAALDPQYRAIVELAYFKGYTQDEIAKALDVPLGTVKTRMRHALKSLREHFSVYLVLLSLFGNW